MSTFGIDVLRFFVGTIFLLSSAAKWRQRDKLIKLVDDYAILPPRSVAPVAQLLPVAELALAAGLLTNVIPVVPASIACVFALAFAIAAFITLRRGRSIDCGCFGVSSTEKVTCGKLLFADYVLQPWPRSSPVLKEGYWFVSLP
ncbi:MAG: hypothetical protein H0W21_14145 [Actinobacteria bacterium]|nr:hypothetical protein [Actinomycetota bacterium]